MLQLNQSIHCTQRQEYQIFGVYETEYEFIKPLYVVKGEVCHFEMLEQFRNQLFCAVIGA